MSSRRPSRSLKRVEYAGLDVEDSEIEEIKPARPAKRRKKNSKPDEDFELDAQVDEENDAPGLANVVPHSRSLHGVTRLSPLLEGLLSWFGRVKNARGMPWRKEYDGTLSDDEKAQRAYEVLVSEIMLQQTQVTTVIPYYKAWLERFPTIRDLAEVDDIEEVNKYWKGLGYYRRAGFLHQAAKKVVSDFGGRIPSDVAVLAKQVPGVGKYTAGAVTSIVYNVQAPAVDGNVLRLFSRLLAVHAPLKSKATLDAIWGAADTLVKKTSRPGDLNQAFIELGSTICKPENPSCSSCPLNQGCAAYRLANRTDVKDLEDLCDLCEPFPDKSLSVTRFPMKVSKKPPRVESSVVTVLEITQGSQEWILMRKRPKGGLLAGLWEFPTTDLEKTATLSAQMDAARALVRKLIPHIKDKHYTPTAIGDFLHLFSHIRKTYYVVLVRLEEDILMEPGENFKWVKKEEFSSMNVGKGNEKVWKLLSDHGS